MEAIKLHRVKRRKRPKDEGHMAALIRRKMITQIKKNKKEYTRKLKHKKNVF